MAVHVQIWSGAGNAGVTDMTNAGKRGKVCRTFSFCSHYAERSTAIVLHYLAHDVAESADYDAVRAHVGSLVTAENTIYDREIRGIDAPKPVLTATVEGEFSASIDSNGVHVSDLSDMHNEPRAITSKQSTAQAYKLAAKAWAKVQAASSFHEATNVLRDAGCSLHHYCAMD